MLMKHLALSLSAMLLYAGCADDASTPGSVVEAGVELQAMGVYGYRVDGTAGHQTFTLYDEADLAVGTMSLELEDGVTVRELAWQGTTVRLVQDQDVLVLEADGASAVLETSEGAATEDVAAAALY